MSAVVQDLMTMPRIEDWQRRSWPAGQFRLHRIGQRRFGRLLGSGRVAVGPIIVRQMDLTWRPELPDHLAATGGARRAAS
jgi:hypothetical protein